jgi:DNA-binding transcriptional MerR regulator
MKTPSSDKQNLLSGLRLGEVASIAGVSEATLQNWYKHGHLPIPPIQGKWRRHTAEHTERAIHLAALVQVVGITPSRAAKMLRQPDKTLEEHGLGDLAPLILRYTEEAISRARQLHAARIEDEQRALEERKMLLVQKAIAELPREGNKVEVLQDLVQSVSPEYAVPVLLLAAGSLGEEAKRLFLKTFLEANPAILSGSVAFPEGENRPGTRIERGHSEFAGVCVHGDRVLLISPGPAGPAFAATLSEDDARLLLDDMDRELARDEDPPRTYVRTFDHADRVAVFVGQPNHLCIGAGEQGGIVAELTREDFGRVRDALADCLKVFRIPAIAAAESAGSSAQFP